MIWPFRKKLTPERVVQIYMDCVRENTREGAALDEWMEGPGKEWPRETQLMRLTEASEPQTVLMLKDGWIEAFKAWYRKKS